MAAPPKLTGLFLGAGASYEAGMPLVGDLTRELKQWLTPDKLRSLNQSWRWQGGRHSDEVIEDFAAVLSRPDLHYESLLGYLETQFNRQHRLRQEYHALYSWLVQMIYFILYFRHINNGEYIKRSLGYFNGLSAFAAHNEPLWVFSLNHDLIVECLAITTGIPLNAGFTNEIVSLPRRNKRGEKIGNLQAAVLPGELLEHSAMPFYRNGTGGINLLKIHGALDVFTFRNGYDLLKILPTAESVDGVLGALRSANEELLYRDPIAPHRLVRATNEIAYADEQGEMQFLRRTLLAGAHKFDSRWSQVLPLRLMEHFRSNINYLTTLVCIGYGFGDNHINHVMRDWLEFSAERRLVIVGPDVTMVPVHFLHISPQVDLMATTATEYLDSVAGIARSKHESNEKRLTAWVRRYGDTADAEVQAFHREHMSRKIESAVQWLNTLPVRDGDIDVDALGVSLDDFIRDGVTRFVELPEDLLEEFLNSRDPPSPARP
ncbi:MAG: hypothetical protein M0R80_24795 [Proteobacteria bacterium]|jgi:hypothetical protein|nr:hypothetical protein [Pseudomonadota bacterium]